MSQDEVSAKAVLSSVATALVVVLGFVVLGMWGCPHYNVYRKTMEGVAALREAESSRQIAVAEAKAKEESAKLLAQAEIERAKGAAEANRIIGESLQGHAGETYLRYLWVTSLEENNNPTVVYIPTEAGMPIMEAGRFGKQQE
jgi:regulator of protease activity HflC (stomatin/prohibitin superfamily)